MDKSRCMTDIRLIEEELDKEPLVRIKDGSGSSHFDGPENWIYGLSMARVARDKYPFMATELNLLERSVEHLYGPIVQVMINRLDAHGGLSPHRDGLPNRARFHLPVTTNDHVLWWDEINGRLHMDRGVWYGPVPYCGVLHSVFNLGEKPRTHLVVDFERGV